MPSANVSAVKEVTNQGGVMDLINNPMKPALTIVEHKIRNLEKRKAKLDQYRTEQDSGKKLNEDQLAAVAKYSEVIQQLDFARDLMKQITQANDESRREIKKFRKAEAVEKTVQETEKLKNLFLIQMVVKELETWNLSTENPETSDLLQNAVLAVKKNEFLQRCHDLVNLYDPNFLEVLQDFASQWLQTLDGSKKSVDAEKGKDSMTYKGIRDSLLAVANSDVFLNKRKQELVVQEQEEVREDAVTSDSESIPSSMNNANIVPVAQCTEQAMVSPAVQPNAMCPPRVMESTATYSFLQDSKIDLESPHFDPAVVAVSSCLPPGRVVSQQHIDLQARSAFTITAAPEDKMATMPNGLANANHNDQGINDYQSPPASRPPPLMNEKITEWVNDVHKSMNGIKNGRAIDHRVQGDREGSEEKEGTSNRFNSNRRGNNNNRGGGGFRGRGVTPRGRDNGGGLGARGGRGSGGFQGHRMGYFRSNNEAQNDFALAQEAAPPTDFMNMNLDYYLMNLEYRTTPKGAPPGSFMNGRTLGPIGSPFGTYSGGYRRPNQGGNFTNSSSNNNNGSGGFRGGQRGGNSRPRTSESSNSQMNCY